MTTAFRQFNLTRSGGNRREDFDTLETLFNRETAEEEPRRSARKPRSLGRMNEVEMCPPQGVQGNYICSVNRDGLRGGGGGCACTSSEVVVSQNVIRDSSKWAQNVIKPVSEINGLIM